MQERNILFIIEGESDEPKFLKKLFRVCFSSLSYRVFVYKTTLHNLASRLETDYPDFDSDCIDIKLVLGSYDPEKKEMLNQKYTDIFLVFDFDPHHDTLHFDTIRRMICFFNDSTEQGKLFINYPMMQSFKHFHELPDCNFYSTKVTIAQCKKYKEIVGNFSSYTDVGLFTYPLFVSIAVHHLRKANYILTGEYVTPLKEMYLDWNYTDIFDNQVASVNNASIIYVLNTCIFIMVDYNPSFFFNQLNTHKQQFLI